MNTTTKLACAALLWPLLARTPLLGQVPTTSSPAAANTTPARVIVTVGHHYGHALPILTPEDLTVTQRFDPLPVVKLTPLWENLELFLLVDNCSSCDPGSKFEEIRAFIQSQPMTTAVGVAYIQDGTLRVAQNPTLDRERTIKALNAPSGSKPAGPFGALAELIRGWRPDTSSPSAVPRRAVLMISSGVDPSAENPLQDASAEAAIEAAERGNVTVYAIYHPSANYLKSDFSQLYAGQVQLAHVAGETGGEAYFVSFGPLPSLGPFLGDIADHLANQYLLEFLANPNVNQAGESGTLLPVTVKSKSPDLELMVPSKAWIPAPRHEHPGAAVPKY